MSSRTAVLLLLTMIGCSRSPHLAGGPIEIKQAPVVVRFEHPVRSPGPLWELCFEFDLPGDSHDAGGINAVLLTSSAQRYPFITSRLDRRGEAVVCQIGQVVALDSPDVDSSQWQSVTYDAVELSANVPLRLRGLRGGCRVE
jgi:hypothetical protein